MERSALFTPSMKFLLSLFVHRGTSFLFFFHISFCFSYGLSYTTFTYETIKVTTSGQVRRKARTFTFAVVCFRVLAGLFVCFRVSKQTYRQVSWKNVCAPLYGLQAEVLTADRGRSQYTVETQACKHHTTVCSSTKT